MDQSISEPLITSADISCLESDCVCETSAQAVFQLDGRLAAPAEDTTCLKCKHPHERHHVVGLSPSEFERQQILSGGSAFVAEAITLTCSSCRCVAHYSGVMVVGGALCSECGHKLKHHRIGADGRILLPVEVEAQRRFY